MSTNEDQDLISHSAEIFRTKCIHQFSLLKSKNGTLPDLIKKLEKRYTTTNLLNENKLIESNKKDPFMLVNFEIADALHITKRFVTAEERRRNLISYKTSSWPPLCLCAEWIIENKFFRRLITCCLLVNIIVLGIKTCLPTYVERMSSMMYRFIIVIYIIDLFTVLIFAIDIFLKLSYSFKKYWYDFWNWIDFIVTVGAISFTMISHIFRALDINDYNLEKYDYFRSLRSLKLLAEFKVLRVVMASIAMASRELVFILLLTFIFATIYAFIGVIFFDYTSVDKNSLTYPHAFDSIATSIEAILQIFTNDHWVALLVDIGIVESQFISFLFVFSWFIIGSFFCQNIILSIIVSSFEKIVQQKEAELEEQSRIEELSKVRNAFHNIAKKSDNVGMDEEEDDNSSRTDITDVSKSDYNNSEKNEGLIKSALDQIEFFKRNSYIPMHSKKEAEEYTYEKEEDWRKLVYDNLPILSSEKYINLWPRDTLLRYYEIMEALMENIEERKRILILITQILHQVPDL